MIRPKGLSTTRISKGRDQLRSLPFFAFQSFTIMKGVDELNDNINFGTSFNADYSVSHDDYITHRFGTGNPSADRCIIDHRADQSIQQKKKEEKN